MARYANASGRGSSVATLWAESPFPICFAEVPKAVSKNCLSGESVWEEYKLLMAPVKASTKCGLLRVVEIERSTRSVKRPSN